MKHTQHTARTNTLNFLVRTIICDLKSGNEKQAIATANQCNITIEQFGYLVRNIDTITEGETRIFIQYVVNFQTK